MVGSELDMDSAELASYDDYASALASAVEAKSTVVNLLDLSDRVRFLNPMGFALIVGGERQLLTATASNLLLIILQTIQLRRVKGEVIRVATRDVIIRASIPPYRVTTVELEMSTAEAQRYSEVHLKTLS
jgi:hypothetical protein